jgi:hypothetical protein
VWRDFACDVVELGGLVAEHDEIRALGDFDVALKGLPSDLGGESGGALGQGV